MPANALCLTAPETDLQPEEAAAGEPRGRGRPATGLGQWRSLFAAAGFDIDDGAHDAEGDIPVQRCISALDAWPLLDAQNAPASVFELALKPLEMHPVCIPPSLAAPVLTARRIERTAGVTRCVNIPITDSAEWQEREQARRARQRPPRPSRQRFKLRGSTNWAA